MGTHSGRGPFVGGHGSGVPGKIADGLLCLDEDGGHGSGVFGTHDGGGRDGGHGLKVGQTVGS